MDHPIVEHDWGESDDDFDRDEIDRLKNAYLAASASLRAKQLSEAQPSINNTLNSQPAIPSQLPSNPGLQDAAAAAVMTINFPQPSLPSQQSAGGDRASPAVPAAAGGSSFSAPRYPNTLSDLYQCIDYFQRTLDLIPPPKPPSLDCPGFHGRGCGGHLEWISFPHDPSADSFWGCSKFGLAYRSSCSYRFYPPKRLDHPRLQISVVAPAVIEVAPYPGAEEAVKLCGGVARILHIVGVELEGAVKRGEEGMVSPKTRFRSPKEKHAKRNSDGVGGLLGGGGGGGGGRGRGGSEVPSPASAAFPTEGNAAPPPSYGVPLLQQGFLSSNTTSAAGAGPDETFLNLISHAPHGSVRFPISHYSALHKLLLNALSLSRDGQGNARGLMVAGKGGIPEGTLKAFQHPGNTRCSDTEVAARYAALPVHLKSALLPFQRDGVRFGLARGGRCLIGDEMGVGKTVQGLALAAAYKGDGWPLLVVVPASMRLQWAEEFEKWMPGLNPGLIHVISDKSDQLRPTAHAAGVFQGVADGAIGGVGGGSTRSNRSAPPRNSAPTSPPGTSNNAVTALPEVCIVSYRMLEHLTCIQCKRKVGVNGMAPNPRRPCLDPKTCMASLPWRMMIVDESHTLRTRNIRDDVDSMQTEALRATARNIPRLVFLSGTPSLNKPYDLFNQVSILRPDIFPPSSRREFGRHYCHLRAVPVKYYTLHGVICAGNDGPKRYDVSGLMRATELHLLLRQEIMIRRLKKDVLDQLPPKRRQVVRLPKPPAKDWPLKYGGAAAAATTTKGRHQADASDASSGEESEGEEEHGGGPEGAGSNVRAGNAPAAKAEEGNTPPPLQPKRMSAPHRTGLAKCRLATEWLLEQLGLHDAGNGEGGGAAGTDGIDSFENSECAASGVAAPSKFIVFAHHRDVMNHLYEKLDAALTDHGGVGGASTEGAAAGGKSPSSSNLAQGLRLLRIDGDTPQEERREVVERFRSDRRVRVALLSVTAAGQGLDFSAASAVVFVELPAEASLVRQAEDRAHRQGQKRPVNIYFLCARGTCDERHWQRLSSNLAKVDAVTEGPAAVGAAAANGVGGGLLVDDVMNVQDKEEEEFEKRVEAVEDEAAKAQKTEQQPCDGVAVSPTDSAGDSIAAGVIQPEKTAEQNTLMGDDEQIIDLTGSQFSAPAPVAPVEVRHVTQHPPAPPPPSGIAAGETKGHLAGHTPSFVSPEKLNAQSQHHVEADCWWFEVSAQTHRVHFHAAHDRSQPLLLSFPLEALLIPDAPSVSETIAEVTRQLELQRKTKVVAVGAISSLEKERQRQLLSAMKVNVVGGVGPICVDVSSLTSVEALKHAISAARAFAAEWRELPVATRARLFNKLLQTPLDDAAEVVTAEAGAEGAFGTSTERYLGSAAAGRKLPNGVEWMKVGVRYERLGNKIMSYDQPVRVIQQDGAHAASFEAAGQQTRNGLPPLPALSSRGEDSKLLAPHKIERLCSHCFHVVPGAEVTLSHLHLHRSAGGDAADASHGTAAPGSTNTLNSSTALDTAPGVTLDATADKTAPLSIVLDSAWSLFCKPECQRKYAVKSSGGAARRAVYKRDRGVCAECHVDCTALIRRLQAVERGTKDWRLRRMEALQRHDAEFIRRAGPKAVEALIERATAGKAWQADHVIPVYSGGGQCDVDNLRTLCTPCHKEVTKRQAGERKVERKKAAGDGEEGAEPPRRRAKRERKFIDVDDDDARDKDGHFEAGAIFGGGRGRGGRGRSLRRGRSRGKSSDTGGGRDGQSTAIDMVLSDKDPFQLNLAAVATATTVYMPPCSARSPAAGEIDGGGGGADEMIIDLTGDSI